MALPILLSRLASSYVPSGLLTSAAQPVYEQMRRLGEEGDAPGDPLSFIVRRRLARAGAAGLSGFVGLNQLVNSLPRRAVEAVTSGPKPPRPYTGTYSLEPGLIRGLPIRADRSVAEPDRLRVGRGG